MSRAAALAFLDATYAEQFDAAGIVATDTGTTLGPVIDEAALALGTDYGDLATVAVANADVGTYRLALRYFGLSRILEAVRRSGTDITSPDAGIKRSQYIATLREDLAGLAAQLSGYGVVVGPIGPTWQGPTTFNTDWIEPERTWA